MQLVIFDQAEPRDSHLQCTALQSPLQDITANEGQARGWGVRKLSDLCLIPPQSCALMSTHLHTHTYTHTNNISK